MMQLTHLPLPTMTFSTNSISRAQERNVARLNFEKTYFPSPHCRRYPQMVARQKVTVWRIRGCDSHQADMVFCAGYTPQMIGKMHQNKSCNGYAGDLVKFLNFHNGKRLASQGRSVAN
jgi:hypothetical protein